jgi:AAA+ superfamily predicted ATPase
MKFPEHPKTLGNRPRGVFLLSPPGCGKNQFATALNSETGSPPGVLDVGAVLGSLIKQHLFCKSRFSEVSHLVSMFR